MKQERGRNYDSSRSKLPLYQSYVDMRVADLTQFCRLYRKELSIFVDRVVENNEIAKYVGDFMGRDSTFNPYLDLGTITF